MKKTLNFIFIFMSCFSFIYALTHMQDIFLAVSLSLNTIFSQIIPSLLPFMILTYILTKTGIVHIVAYILQFLLIPIFGMSGQAGYVFILSMFTGFPGFAKLIKDNYDEHNITVEEVNRLICISSFASISFLYNTLSKQDPNNFRILLLAHFLPNIIFALFTRKRNCKYISIEEAKISFKRDFRKIKIIKLLKDSIVSSFTTLLFVSGFIIIFNLFIQAISQAINSELLLVMIHSLLEFSSGTIKLTQIIAIDQYLLPLLAFFVSFSGICVQLQVFNILEDIEIKHNNYLLFRTMHAILSGIFTVICLII